MDFISPDDDQFLLALCGNAMFMKDRTTSEFSVNVLDSGWTEGGDFYQVLDLEVDAVPLNRQALPMLEGDVLAMGLSVLRALKHAHRKEITHGTISPSAIYETAGKFRLGEFWWAHNALGKLFDVELFQYFPLNVPQDALAFFAPEVLVGYPLTRESDLYALAATMFYLLTGEYARQTPATIDPLNSLQDLSAQKSRSLLEVKQGFSSHTVALLRQMLDPDGDNRSNIFLFEDLIAAALGISSTTEEESEGVVDFSPQSESESEG